LLGATVQKQIQIHFICNTKWKQSCLQGPIYRQVKH